MWKNVRRYAEDRFTSVIHGKVWHEETQATASQALKSPAGPYLVVLDRAEADVVCEYIRRGGRPRRVPRDSSATPPRRGSIPTGIWSRIGLANQTTMLMSESLAIGEMFRAAMAERYGEAGLSAHFRAFDTICSATQDRQDAVAALLEEHALDLMLVVGGYNSSNTLNLARICAARVPTFHIADDGCLVSAASIRHRPVGSKSETGAQGWLPSGGPLRVGLTSGASTPDNVVGAVILRLATLVESVLPDPVTPQGKRPATPSRSS